MLTISQLNTALGGSDVSEKEKLLREIALSSLKNAEQYAKDAEVLLKKRSYGHAFA